MDLIQTMMTMQILPMIMANTTTRWMKMEINTQRLTEILEDAYEEKRDSLEPINSEHIYMNQPLYYAAVKASHSKKLMNMYNYIISGANDK